MKIEIETPVSIKQGYPSDFTKFGIVEGVESGRATVLWLVEEILTAPKHARRINRRSKVAVDKLQHWDESTRIRLRNEGVTVTASGMEYRSPVNA